MAARTYREKRQMRKRSIRTPGKPTPPPQRPMESARLISLGSFTSLVPVVPRGPELSVVVADRYAVRVGSGFQPTTPPPWRGWYAPWSSS